MCVPTVRLTASFIFPVSVLRAVNFINSLRFNELQSFRVKISFECASMSIRLLTLREDNLHKFHFASSFKSKNSRKGIDEILFNNCNAVLCK